MKESSMPKDNMKTAIEFYKSLTVPPAELDDAVAFDWWHSWDTAVEGGSWEEFRQSGLCYGDWKSQKRLPE
jgi:hypothetical protein